MQRQAKYKRYLIDVSTSWRAECWAGLFGVSEDALLDAIDQVGNQAHAVEEYLSNRKAHEQHQRPL